MSIEALRPEILKLSKPQRLELARFILDTLVEENEGEFFLSEEQKREISRRIESIKDGTANTFSWEEVTAYAKSNA